MPPWCGPRASAPWSSRWRRCGSLPTTACSRPTRSQAVRALLLAGDPEGYARTCEALAVADTSAAVPSIAAPTLVVCGEADAPPFRMALDWLARSLPDARTAWLSGAHATAYEHPDEFADLLVDFLG